MAKKIKAPKLKKYPKKPKATASAEAWERWNAKARQFEKDNAQKLSDHNKKIREKEGAKKKKDGIIKKARSLSGIALPKGKKK